MNHLTNRKKLGEKGEKLDGKVNEVEKEGRKGKGVNLLGLKLEPITIAKRKRLGDLGAKNGKTV